LKTQDEMISEEAEKRSRETKAAVKKGKRTEVP
jgi:hypothetical protein